MSRSRRVRNAPSRGKGRRKTDSPRALRWSQAVKYFHINYIARTDWFAPILQRLRGAGALPRSDWPAEHALSVNTKFEILESLRASLERVICELDQHLRQNQKEVDRCIAERGEKAGPFPLDLDLSFRNRRSSGVLHFGSTVHVGSRTGVCGQDVPKRKETYRRTNPGKRVVRQLGLKCSVATRCVAELHWDCCTTGICCRRDERPGRHNEQAGFRAELRLLSR